jgi:hypothetical protein
MGMVTDVRGPCEREGYRIWLEPVLRPGVTLRMPLLQHPGAYRVMFNG